MKGVDATGEAIVARYQQFAAEEGVFDDLFACLRRNLNAKKSMRVESKDREAGYSYEVVEDSIAQIAAARTLAQLLRLMSGTSSAVTINQSETNVTVTAEQRVAELDSIGVPREVTREACLAMIDATDKSPAITPATPKLG